MIMAAPTAWNMRDMIKTGNELRKTGRNPVANEPAVNIRNPNKKTFLNPIPSEIFPNIRTHPAITRM
jgi:hypothetical protein